MGDTEVAPDDVHAGQVGSAEAPAGSADRGGPSFGNLVRWLYQGLFVERTMADAAAVTFYTLLALFPGIAALVSIFGLFADPARLNDHLDAASGILPGGGMEVLRDQLTRLTKQGRAALGIGFVIGLLVSLWSANGGIKAMFDALNVVYREDEKRSFLKLTGISLLFTLAMIVFMLIAIFGLIAVPLVLQHLPGYVAAILEYARWPVLAVLVALALALIYRYGPSHSEPHWHWIGWGNSFAALAWLGVSALFTWYAANFGTFNKTYGSLGAIVGFMTWMWLSIIVVLLGAKLNAELKAIR
jgi:membrane protein